MRVPELGQAEVPERVPGLVQVPEQALVLGQEQVLVLGQVRLGRVLVALAWVLDQGQALVKVDLDQVVIKDRTAMALAMEPAMTVSVRQTVQVMAQAMVPVRAGMDRAASANNAKPLALLKGSPHPNPLPQCGGAWQGEGASLTNARPDHPDLPTGRSTKRPQQDFILHPRSIPCVQMIPLAELFLFPIAIQTLLHVGPVKRNMNSNNDYE